MSASSAFAELLPRREGFFWDVVFELIDCLFRTLAAPQWIGQVEHGTCLSKRRRRGGESEVRISNGERNKVGEVSHSGWYHGQRSSMVENCKVQGYEAGGGVRCWLKGTR